jgi:hypothetical protein
VSQFTEEFAELLQHVVTVRTLDGADAMGHRFLPPEVLTEVMVMETSQVIQMASGEYKQSMATIHADVSRYDQFTEGSTVHLPTGRDAKVIKRDRLAMPGWPSHCVVYTS